MKRNQPERVEYIPGDNDSEVTVIGTLEVNRVVEVLTPTGGVEAFKTWLGGNTPGLVLEFADETDDSVVVRIVEEA